MSAVNAPFGLRPVQMTGGQYNTGAARWLPMTADTSAIAKGALVSLSSSGAVVACTAAGTTTRDVNTPVGVVLGVRYIDPTLHQAQWGQYLPANAITAGYTSIYVQVCDDMNALFEVQSSGSIAATDIGANVTPATFTVDATKGLSNTVVGSVGTSTAMFRIIDIPADALNAAGDAYTRVYVRFNRGYHAYDNAVGL